MKAKIKKTGEIVDVISYGGDTVRYKNDYVSYIDSKGVEHVHVPMNYYWDVEEIDESANATHIDWEKRRYEIAKAALTPIMCNNQFYDQVLDEAREEHGRTRVIPNNIARAAVVFADALIYELKKGGKDEQGN